MEFSLVRIPPSPPQFSEVLKINSLLRIYRSGCSAVRLAHLFWEQGVAGSNPATPTHLPRESILTRLFYLYGYTSQCGRQIYLADQNVNKGGIFLCLAIIFLRNSKLEFYKMKNITFLTHTISPINLAATLTSVIFGLELVYDSFSFILSNQF